MEIKQKKPIEKGNLKLQKNRVEDGNKITQTQPEEREKAICDNPSQEKMITGNFIQALRTFMLREYDTSYLESDNVSLFADILELLDHYADELDSLSEQNRVVVETIADNPRLMIFIKELTNGTPLRVALAKSDLTDMQPDKDDEDYDAYNYAVAISRERREKAKNEARERVVKCEQCGEVARKFYEELELDPDEVERFINFLHTIIEAIYDANIDSHLLHSLWRAFAFDKEIKIAKDQGVIEGKNSIINNRRTNYSDGLPSYSSAGSRQENNQKEGYIETLMKRKFN